jgi:hypothetical protein
MTPELKSFIAATFPSVWTLEVLMHLRARRETAFDREALVSDLRASGLVIDQSLNRLAAAGLVLVDETGRAQFAPADARLDALSGEAEQFYAKSPDAVRRLIVAAANPGVAAFADAFKLKGDQG